MSTITEGYDYFFKELADPRVFNWPLMSDPWGFIGILLLYLYSVIVFLPSYMADKKPYVLKEVIQIYNIYQVVACSILIYGVATSGWTTYYTLGCQLVDYSEDKLAMRMANFMWWHMVVKMSELLETVFFILRKKSNQVTGLHLYHHASTALVAWVCLKYTAGGMATFTVLLNSAVHVLMYSYYFLASLGPEMQTRLQVVKSKLTLIQITQLCILFVHTIQMILPSCKFPSWAGYLYLPNLAINITLFLQFYTKSYLTKKETTKKIT